jgi:regulatory protein
MSDGSDDAFSEALQSAADRLARRDHAEQELRLKLERSDFGPDVIDRVIDRLDQEGLVDDEAFAERQAGLLRDKSWGPARIRTKLRDRGVDDAVIDRALESVGDYDTWLDRCYQRLVDKFGQPSDEWSQRQKKKVFRHLRHRGYRSAMIRRILFDGVTPKNR